MKLEKKPKRYTKNDLSEEKKKELKEKTKTYAMEKIGRKLKILGITAMITITAVSIDRIVHSSQMATEQSNEIEEQKNEVTETPIPIIPKEVQQVPVKFVEKQPQQLVEKQPQQENILEKMLEIYNSNVTLENQLQIQDIGIIKQDLIGNGNIYKTHNERGEEIYVQNHLDGLNKDTSNIEWIEGNEIKQVLVIVNKKDRSTMSGVIETKEGEISPIYVKTVMLDDQTTYTKSEPYISFKKENIEKSYKLLNEEWSKRNIEQQMRTEDEER